MAPEQHSEIPRGYIWKDCPGINARFPMPETWFFMTQEAAGTRAFFMTRESIERRGMFFTGLSINVITDISHKAGGRSAVDMALGLMETLPLQPISQIIRADDGPLVVARRFFSLLKAQYMPIPQYGRAEVAVKLMQPTHFYFETVGNRETDTVYIIQFETPTSSWEKDKKIARTMIENGILDKSI